MRLNYPKAIKLFSFIAVVALVVTGSVWLDVRSRQSGAAVQIDAPATCQGPALPPAGPGQFRTPTGQLVAPAGDMLALDSLPLGMALSRSGKWLVTSNNSEGAQSLSLVQLGPPLRLADREAVSSAFVGVAFSPDGRQVYASSGGGDSLLVLRMQYGGGGKLTKSAEVLVPGYPAGLALSADGKQLFVAQNLSSSVAIVDPIGQRVLAQVPVEPYPYSLAITPDGSRLYVAHWLGEVVSVVDTRQQRQIATVKVGKHPTGIAVSKDGSRVFVADASSDDLSVIDAKSMEVIQNVSLSPYPGAKHGSSPNGVAVSAKDSRVYVTLAGNNAVAVVEAGPGGYRVQGSIPTGWYPSAVALTPDESSLIVLSAKGLGAKDLFKGKPPAPAPTFPGAVQVVRVPSDAELAQMTALVQSNNRLVSDSGGTHPAVLCSEVPWLRELVKHVVYILKENRSFDQVLGDLPGIDGEPALALFGRQVTPNMHAIAREFVTADRYFVDGEVSALGHQWSEAADTTDYTERTWPQYYSNRGRTNDAKQERSIPPGGLLFDAAAAAGISYQVYGEIFTRPDGTLYPSLQGHRSPVYPGFNLDIPDQRRADLFLSDFAQYEASGQLPSLVFIWLPNDHTAGTAQGKKTPRALVADNDLALGRIIDRISHSRFWSDTVVFVTEDDAQDGPDHVDSHRSVVLAAGGPVKRGYVSHEHYDQASLLRTIELILGLAPMSQFDAMATPMLEFFAGSSNPQGYSVLPAQVPLDEVNTKATKDQSEVVNLAQADDMDDEAFGASVWEAVTGTPYSRAMQIVAEARLKEMQQGELLP